MKFKFCVVPIFVVVFSAATIVEAQSPAQTTDDTIRITTKLVQIDAVVVDKQGNPVTDLKAGDFDLRQDGKPQKVTHSLYIDSTSATASERVTGSEASSPVGAANKKAGPPGRTIAFVVDDGNCGSSINTIWATKDGIKKFINTMMLPTDRVAIYGTRAGSSVLQQYTSDKARLLSIVGKFRYYPPYGLCPDPDSTGTDSAASDAEIQIRERAGDFLDDNQLIGNLAVINYVVRGLEPVGGRKILFLMSPGMRETDPRGRTLRSWSVIRGVAETANRAGVVIDSIDSRGLLNTLVINAHDTISIGDANGFHRSADIASDQANKMLQTRYGMEDLSHLTGGELYSNINDLGNHIERALRHEKGYYLLAYEPDDETFRGKNFNKIEIKVNRPELKVISRPGFAGVPDKPSTRVKRSEESDLYDAIAAPLPAAGLNLQLTAFFGNSADEGNYVRSLVHLPGDELTFVNDADGMKKVSIDVVAVTLDDKNQVVDEFTRGHTFKIAAEALPLIRQNGLTYATDVPIKKAGTYNFRVAIRDNADKNIGSSSQILEIPDLKRGKLFVSGLTISEVDKNGKFTIPGRVKPENAIAITPTVGNPALRQYHRGDVIAYSYNVYNSPLDASTGQPNLLVQMKLYRDGQLVIDGKPEQLKPEKQPDWSRFIGFSYLRLEPDAASGDYTLQVIVRDPSSPRGAVSNQSVDFQILP